LTNQVFLLGNIPKNCKQYIIYKNQYVQGTIIVKILKKIEKHINPYRTKRNVIVHQEGYSHKDLRILEACSILEKQGEDFFHQYYYKRQIDGFVKERKAELVIFNNTLFQLIDDFLTELLKVFEKKYKKLNPV
jgi:vacuolar-type H+-ATPase subunit E/Vma4